MQASAPNIVVLYDSITNSVCESQVIRPWCNKGALHLISFERNPKGCEAVRRALCSRYPGLRITLAFRWPYLSRIQLWWAGRRLARILSQYPAYTLIARGPYAAAIAQRMGRGSACRRFIIQCRGLVAAEYRYTHSTSIIHRFRAAQLERLERYAYQLAGEIEVVSQALGEYIVVQFGVPRVVITIGTQDTYETIPVIQRAQYRVWARAQLNISEDAWVVCYSGSTAPWQCIDESYRYGRVLIAQRPNGILLFLVPDRDIAKISQYQEDRVRMYAAKPAELLRFLCAADIGMLFREPHLMNWISRPTKALEYQAAGVTVAHNNTVKMLVSDEQPSNCCRKKVCQCTCDNSSYTERAETWAQ